MALYWKRKTLTEIRNFLHHFAHEFREEIALDRLRIFGVQHRHFVVPGCVA